MPTASSTIPVDHPALFRGEMQDNMCATPLHEGLLGIDARRRGTWRNVRRRSVARNGDVAERMSGRAIRFVLELPGALPVDRGAVLGHYILKMPELRFFDRRVESGRDCEPEQAARVGGGRR